MPVSIALHVSFAVWGLFAFAQPNPFEVSEESVPVEVVTDGPREITKGVKTAEKVIPNAPERADKVADLRKENDPGQAKTDTSSLKPPSKQEETVKDDPAEVEPAKTDPVKIPDPPTRPPEPPRVASLPTPLPTPRPQPAKPQSSAEDDPTDDKDAEVIREQKKKEQQKAEQQKLEDLKKKQQEQAKQELAKKIAEQQAADAKADAEAKKQAELKKQEEAKKLAEKIAADQAKADAEAKKQAELKKKEADAKAKAVADAKKAAEERKRQEAAQAQPNFDPNAIRNRLLASHETPSSTGATGSQISRTASLGTQTGAGAKLSPSDREALAGILQDQIEKCWSLSVTSAPSTKPIVHIELSADGQLTGGPTLVNSSGDPNFRPVAESGMRAIRQCAPYRIPAKFLQYYSDWKVINVRLDPSSML